MSEIKKSNRGGARPGAGRPTDATRSAKAKEYQINYTPKTNIVKELEDIFKKMKKISTKDELLILQAQADVLNKLLPYAANKKPVADTSREEKPTVVEVKGIDLDKL